MLLRIMLFWLLSMLILCLIRLFICVMLFWVSCSCCDIMVVFVLLNCSVSVLGLR